ncbi:MAG: polysaccharide deacetylase family protein [Actinomycetota bacterium]
MNSNSLLRKASKAAVLPAGLARLRRSGDLVILLYHRVGTGNREIDLDASVFERQIAHLAAAERVVTLDRVLQDPEGGVVVTVDDGFRDFHEVVLPLLVTHRVPVLLYLATSLVDRRGADPDRLTWEHLREAVSTGYVSVGAHTHSHADLSRATEAESRREMTTCKNLIEDELGTACEHFSYPWSYASPPAERVARELFATAALPWRTNRSGRIESHQLGRTPVLRSDGTFFFKAKLRGAMDNEAHLYRLLGRGPWRR